jgi:L-rhamnose 1-dehydrogenase
MRLKGKVAVVTGAARGIGRAVALRFAAEGARVAVIDLRETEGRDAVRAIEAAGGEAMFLRTDVSSAEQIDAAIRAVLDRWDHIDILVNDAGICPFEDFLAMPESIWDQVLDTNLKGYFLMSQAVARTMVERGIPGRIIAVSSISAEFGGSRQAHYCASKAGINLLVKSMAISLGPHGITCNAVLPGTVETDINRDALSDPQVREYWSQRTPLGRFGQPDDIAGPALFFASDDSAWCTGAMLVADGGVSINLQ